MSSLVPLELMAENLAKGPGKDALKYKISWTTCLKIFKGVTILYVFICEKIMFQIALFKCWGKGRELIRNFCKSKPGESDCKKGKHGGCWTG